MNHKAKLLIVLAISLLSMQLYSQETKTAKYPLNLNITGDFMSRYIWRGLDYGASPSIQPTISLSKGNFELGSWGAISTRGTYCEIDLYAKYTFKGFSVIATDYFFPTEVKPDLSIHKYFNFNNHSTGHIFETALQYKGTEKFPVSVLVGTMLWGFDKNADSKNLYSTYAELGWTFNINHNKLDVFAGMTTKAGLYGNTLGFVNCGITAYKSIVITDKFTLPLKASLITNPQTQNIHLIIGFTL